MSDLSELATELQQQLDILNTYLKDKKLPQPSFLPPEGDVLKSPLDGLPPQVEEARKKAQGLSWSLSTLLQPPQVYLSWSALQFYDVVALRIILERKVASTIPVHSPGVNVSEIATKVGLPENRLIHLLRQLTSINIFRESSPRHFAHTAASAQITSPEFALQVDLILHFIDDGYKASAYLSEALDQYADQFDKVEKKDLRTAFNLAFKTDMHYFDYIYLPENIPRFGERFGRAMMGGARPEIIAHTLSLYDWSQFKPGDQIIDVGGGVGHIGAAIAKKVKPGVKVIVQDRPSVVEQGRKIYGDVIELQPHDFFQKEPISGAAVYYLRLILHDWPDTVCKTILGNIVPVMGPNSKILIFDLVWRPDDYWVSGQSEDSIVHGYDHGRRVMSIRNLHMLNKLGAKERTEEEWNDLFNSVGLKLKKIYGRENFQAIIEAVKA